MKTIQSSKDITTLEVGDVVVFGDLEHTVVLGRYGYYLASSDFYNERIFETLNINKNKFIKSLGIHINYIGAFPETKSLEELTVIVSALFKEYEKQNDLPKTWEEFCKRNPVTPDEYWIETIESKYCNHSFKRERDINIDKNVCVSLQEAKAHTALIQLRQLRKCYVGDWEPDYKQQYYGIVFNSNALDILLYILVHRSMSFPTRELAKQFLNNFKDLLEIAKPLL